MPGKRWTRLQSGHALRRGRHLLRKEKSKVKRRKVAKKLITGRQRRSPDSRWHFGWHCQSGRISGMRQGDFFRMILPLFVLQDNVFDIYTDVAFFMQWITENILAMGGMQACDFTLEKTPNEGLQQILALNKKDNLYNSIMLPLSLRLMIMTIIITRPSQLCETQIF